MNGLKRCVLAGMASCLLVLPNFALAEDASGSELMTKAETKTEVKPALPEDSHDSGLSQAVQNKNYEQALDIVNRQIEADTDNADLYARRGLIYLMMGSSDEALADSERAISLSPEKPSLYLNRGSVYEQRQDYKLAVKDYTQALTLAKPGETGRILSGTGLF